MATFEERREAAKKWWLDSEAEQRGKGKKNAYRAQQIIRFLLDPSSRERLMADIAFAADWFEHDNVLGRDPRGEADFEAIRLAPLYAECYEALDDSTKASMDRFFLERDYSSIYGSENHALMFRSARLLAAQYYKAHGDRHFLQFGNRPASAIYDEDAAFLHEFLDYRAKNGWGEFDSHGYAAEIVLIVGALYGYAGDEALREKARMTLNIILLDMVCESKNGLYGGAHGRSYPDAVLNTARSGMFRLYCFFFGEEYGVDATRDIPYTILLSGFKPDEIVYSIAKNRTFPYFQRETKHLHLMSAWSGSTIHRENLRLAKDRYISKQTYVGEHYMLGAINHQDYYPTDLVNDAGYAHHQQHEWELTLLGGTTHHIFTHHPGDPGYHKIHNRVTGDAGCQCGTFYTNADTALCLYNITKPDEYPYINAFVPFPVFDTVKKDGRYLFLDYGTLYIAMYFSEGYRVNDFDEYMGTELLSDGRQHAVVTRVGEAEKYENFEAFMARFKSIDVLYDKEENTLGFDGLKLWYHGNAENGVENVYPYPHLYESPYMNAERGTGVITVTDGRTTRVYDFGCAGENA